MALRCVYTDLDGTLLGRGGSLFRDAAGAFSRAQALALEACERAGVEVVVMSGRREAQVHEDARLIGQRSYIYEAGCGVVVDGERTLLTGEWAAEDGSTARRMIEARVPELLFERFPARLDWHAPWHLERKHSHLFRGSVDTTEADAVLAEHGFEDLRLLDNGAINRRMEGIEVAHAYHLVPRGAGKAAGVAAHMRMRGYDPAECIALGDALEDLAVADVVGGFFVVANGPERDPGLREALPGRRNVSVTEGSMGDGFYEAVVATLATA